MSSFVYLVTIGFGSSFILYLTNAQEALEIQPYQKAYSVSGLNWGLVADLDYIVIYGHINILNVPSTSYRCGFSLSINVEPYYRLLCSMKIHPQTLCVTDPRRDLGNVCYCEDKKMESMTIVMNMTARVEMNDSTILFWLDNEKISIRIPEPIFESVVVTIPPVNGFGVETKPGTSKDAPVIVNQDTPFMRLVGSFQVLVFAFFTVAALTLIVILVTLIRRFNPDSNDLNQRASVGPNTSTTMTLNEIKPVEIVVITAQEEPVAVEPSKATFV